MKKILAFVLVFCSLSLVVSFDGSRQVNAASYEEHFPTYSLYTQENVIKKENVLYDISTVADYQIEEKLSYEVSGAKGSVHDFYVPISSHVYDIPDVEVKVNGVTINTELLYGADSIWFTNDTTMANAVSKAYDTTIDETVTGTLYTVTAASDSMTIAYKIDGTYPMIYECGNKYTASFSDGITTYTTNTTQGQTYKLFVIGTDFEVFETTDTFFKSTMTCKKYIDDYYAQWQEYYDYCNLKVGYLYSEMSRLLDSKNKVRADDFFLDSHNYRMNFYKFSIELQEEVTQITYSQRARVQRDTTYEPHIYLFERKKSAQYPTEYTIKSTEEFPFVIESNIDINKDGNTYKVITEGNSFYAIYCSEDSSHSIFAEKEQDNKLVWYIVLAVVSAIAIGAITYFVIISIERKKRWK